MDGPRDDHIKYKSDRERQISYDITYVRILKNNNTKKLVYKTEIDSHRKQTFGYQRVKVGERGIN